MLKHRAYAISAMLVLLVLAGCGSAEPAVPSGAGRSGAPTSGAPTSGAPTSGAPTSGATASAAPSPSPAAGGRETPISARHLPERSPRCSLRGSSPLPASPSTPGTFSPDGREYYFYRFKGESRSKILFSKVVHGGWTAPRQLQITAGHEACTPYLTPDDKWLYFFWERPIPEGQTGYIPKGGFWVAKRTPSGWSAPRYAGQAMFLSASRDGRLYTTDRSTLNTDGKTFLAQVTTRNGLFTDYERLPIEADQGSPAHPCIAPDGSYMVFDVYGGEYLYVSFRNPDGTWGEAIDLTEHGFDTTAGGASLSPDGKYLFFYLRDDIWWVDAEVIEDLRPAE